MVLGIYRARKYSPAKSEDDRQILDEVMRLFSDDGMETEVITEEELMAGMPLPDAEIYLSMARSAEVLAMLDAVAERCMNVPDGIRKCNRREYIANDEKGEGPVWVKRADGSAEVIEDVVFCATETDRDNAIAAMHQRGIMDVVVQPHYVGDIVKCYGVAGCDFFHYSYPTETHQTKFGMEIHNGVAHHYPFSSGSLKARFDEIATSIGVPVYGGDAIIQCDGSIHIIDFNDWPTFSPCREEAAKAIRRLRMM